MKRIVSLKRRYGIVRWQNNSILLGCCLVSLHHRLYEFSLLKAFGVDDCMNIEVFYKEKYSLIEGKFMQKI